MKEKRKVILTVCGISAACLAILFGCWYFSRSDSESFTANAAEPSAVSSWVASPLPAADQKPAVSSAVETPKKPLKGYPKVVTETASEVVIDFTPPESVPVEESAETQPEPQEEYTPPEEAETGGGGGETAGQPTGDGVIDDPAFGKVYAGEAQQQEVDNDGDPEKQVGTM